MSGRVPSIAEATAFVENVRHDFDCSGPVGRSDADCRVCRTLAVLRAVRPLLRKARRQHDGEDIGWTFDDANILDALLAPEPGERGEAT